MSPFIKNALAEGVDITSLILKARREGRKSITVTTTEGVKKFTSILSISSCV